MFSNKLILATVIGLSFSYMTQAQTPADSNNILNLTDSMARFQELSAQNPHYMDARNRLSALREELATIERNRPSVGVRLDYPAGPGGLTTGLPVQSQSGIVGEFLGYSPARGEYMILTKDGIATTSRPPTVLKNGAQIKLPNGLSVQIFNVQKATRNTAAEFNFLERGHSGGIATRTIKAIEIETRPAAGAVRPTPIERIGRVVR